MERLVVIVGAPATTTSMAETRSPGGFDLLLPDHLSLKTILCEPRDSLQGDPYRDWVVSDQHAICRRIIWRIKKSGFRRSFGK